MYHTLYLDPPWKEVGGGKIKRGADKHYSLLKVEDMPKVILGSNLWLPAKNAHCYLWVTNTFLPKGLWLMNELGFTYKTNTVWVKKKIGIGQYFRGKHELLLFGTKGKGMDPEVLTGRRDLPSAIIADHVKTKGKKGKIIHSSKPKEFYEMIEARSNGPYVEFFARGDRRYGWTTWGLEI